MDFLKDWITNIILFILLATVIDMLLPNSSMQKYTKMVIGLLLITIILTPVLKVFTHNYEDVLASIQGVDQEQNNNNIENLIEMKKKEIQASTDAYILEQMAVQLKKEVEKEMMTNFEMEVVAIELKVNEQLDKTFPNNMKEVLVQLKEPEQNNSDAVEVVQHVIIDTSKDGGKENTFHNESEITNWLSKKWELAPEQIELQIEGGSEGVVR